MKSKYLLALSAFLVVVFYYLTCFRTFTWWDSSEYSLAALILGIPHPPGSLLTVLIGWLITLLPLGISKFFALNLLASLMAAITAYIIGRLAIRLLDEDNNPSNSTLIILAVSITALFFGLTHTMWYYAIRFTPYIATALLTGLILLAIFAWVRKIETQNSYIYFGLILLLFGLDFSIHRTNLLMLPCILVWLALFNPRGFVTLKYYIYGIAGLIIGLAVQLINIPLAGAQPFLNANNPDNISRFCDYINLKQYGGGWLINMFPRKAPFWGSQITDYLHDFGGNFANGVFPPIGYLPLLLGFFGLIMLIRKSWKLGLGFMVMFIFSSLGAIIYFNLSADFFRSIDRHYMPSFVIFGLFALYGAGALIQFLSRNIALSRQAVLIMFLALILLLPLQAIKRNYSVIDGSKSYFAYNTAKNLLSTLPPNAILFTQSDIDTFTPWCLQIGENYRTDVTICNSGLMNTPWFFKQILASDKAYPYRPSESEIDSFAVIPWQDSTMSITHFSETTSSSDTIRFTIPPSIAGKYLLVSDQILYQTIQANNWKRPICFSTFLPDENLRWLKPYLRLDGLFFQLIPEKSAREDYSVLAANLTQNYKYDGYCNPLITKEEATRWAGWNYCSSFITLAYMQSNSGDTAGCVQTISKLNSLIPAADIGAPQQLLDAIGGACK